jgi:CheY-like chemotaxis protein
MDKVCGAIQVSTIEVIVVPMFDIKYAMGIITNHKRNQTPCHIWILLLQLIKRIVKKAIMKSAIVPGPKVLVVDDHDINRKLTGFWLKKMNILSTYCDNGLAALQLVQCEHFDLVLLDVHLPVMNGLVVTKSIRALHGKASDIPIIIYTANHSRESRDLSKLAGANEFLPKPVDFQSFKMIVMKCLKHNFEGVSFNMWAHLGRKPGSGG